MGKPRAHTKAQKLARRMAAEPSYSLEELLDKAQELVEEYKYELALKFCQRALELDSDNPRALELTGGLLLELGEVEKAQQCLGRAIVVAPDTGHTKYMTAAQLFSGQEARGLYLKGIELLCSLPSPSPEQQQEATREVSTALVAVSELWMTDLCDEEGAEQEARGCLERATREDPGNPEGWQGLASFLLVVEDTPGAEAALLRSLSLWLPQHLAWAATGEGEQTGLSYNTRLGTVKLLLDLEQFDRAAEILDSLLEEDDEEVAPWYLHGWLNYLRDDPDYHGNVRHYLQKARQVHVRSPTDDEAMVAHIEEILAEVGAEAPPPAPSDTLEYPEESLERAEAIAYILDQEEEGEAMVDS